MTWSFPFYFFISSLLLTLFSLIYCFLERSLERFLPARSVYHFWFPYFLMLLFPFLPAKEVSIPLFSGAGASAFAETGTEYAFLSFSGAPSFTDYSLPSSVSVLQILCIIWGIVWITGILYTGCCQAGCRFWIFHLASQGRRMSSDQDPILCELAEKHRRQLGIKTKVKLYSSCRIHTVLSWGIYTPCILLPEDLSVFFHKKELEYILLHELIHFKKRDVLVNHIVCAFQCLYWFHPAVRRCFSRILCCRETACDASVLSLVSGISPLDYGRAILHFAEWAGKNQSRNTDLGFGSRGTTLKQRIQKIAAYSVSSKKCRWKSCFVLICLTASVLSTRPLLSVYAYSSDKAEDSEGMVWNEQDTSAYFSGFQGTFVLYDAQKDTFLFSDKEKCMERRSPLSTCKPYSALFALDAGIITPEKNLADWDGTSYPFEAWMQNQTLNTAMENSVNWYFQNLDAQNGFTKLSEYYRRTEYGNYDLSGGLKNYWMDSSLKISPWEQTVLLSSLWQNKWKYDPAHVDAVKQSLLLSSSGSNRLYGKTGTSQDGDTTAGWFIGCVESLSGFYTFAVHLEGADDASGSTAASAALSILKDLELYE